MGTTTVTAKSTGLRPTEGRALPRRVGHVTERLIDGELVLYDPVRQRMHALNPTAAAVWMQCDGQHDEADIVAELSALYPRHAPNIADDVAGIIRRLVAEGLLTPDERATA